MADNHLMYSKKARQVMEGFLEARYPEAETARLLEKTRQVYLGFLKDLPDMGGKKNPQAAGIYDSIGLLAFWEALEDKPTLEELDRLNRELFVPQMLGGGFANLNRPWMLRAAHFIFSQLAKLGKRRNWPGNYHMEVEPYDPAVGVRYKFHTCPIADFARAHGYLHLMPALCNADYPMLEGIHGSLIRTTTCANGPYCDYWIVGDQSPHLAEHPLKQDEAGYLYNE